MRQYRIVIVLLLSVLMMGCRSNENSPVGIESQTPVPTVVFTPTEPVTLTESATPAEPTGEIADSARVTHPKDTRTGMEELDRVIDAVLGGDPAVLMALMEFITTGCTNQDGLGGPPKCADGVAEGTLVEVFPFLGPEGHFLSKTDAADWQGLSISGLFAVYRVYDTVYSEPLYPAGEYAIVFLADNGFTDYTFNVRAGKIVRIDSAFGEIPVLDLERFAAEIILPPPAE